MQMTKDKFIRIHLKRGYTVQDFGRMVILSLDNYTAIHHFKDNGEYDYDTEAFWKLERK